MSSIHSILGLADVEIVRVEREQAIHVWAKPKTRACCPNNRKHVIRIKATHQRTLKHTRQGNQLMWLHLSVPKYHCPQCNRYFRHPFRHIRPRYRATETYRLEVFEAHDGGISQRKLTRTHGIGSATVERWYQSFIKQRVAELSSRSCPRILGIDEHFFSRKKGYVTTLVDLQRHKVFDVVLGRSESSLRSYLKRLPGKENVQIIVMDLSETYRRIARRYFPNALIVSDRFHVVRLANHHLLKAWKEQDAIGRKNRGLLSLMRRHYWHLSEEQKVNLQQYLSQYPTLEAMYQAKQRLMRLLLIKNVKKRNAAVLIPELLALIEQFKNSRLFIINGGHRHLLK